MLNTPTIAPKVSVLCLCYNQETFLVESLQSVKRQDYQNTEVVIVDDASSDSSARRIKSFIEENQLDWKLLVHSRNEGICRSLNDGLALCTGKYLQILACDDLIDHDKISTQVSHLETLPDDYALIYSDARVIDSVGDPLEDSFLSRFNAPQPTPSGDVLGDLQKGNFIPAMSVLVRREAILAVGGYDDQIAFEDYDMWLRLAMQFRFHFEDRFTTSYRIHQNNTHASTKIDWDAEYHKIYRKYSENKSFTKHSERHARNYVLHVVADYLNGQLDDRRIRNFRTLTPTASGLPRSAHYYSWCIRHRLPSFPFKAIGKVLEGCVAISKRLSSP